MSASVRSLFRAPIWLVLLVLASLSVRAQTNATCTFKLFTLNSSNNPQFQPNGINDYGTVVGQAFFSPAKGFVRYSGGGVSYFAAPNSATTSFLARNDSGINVGYYSTQGANSNISKGFILQGSTFTSFVHPKAVWGTRLTGINKYNSSVGWYLDSGEFGHGFKRYSNGGLAGLDFPGGHDTQPAVVNDSGTVAGSFADSAGEHGFVYHGGSWAKIDYPGPAGTTQVTGISNGNVVVGISTSQEPYIPFIYVNGTFKVISVPNASFTLVNGIALGGMITGTTVPNGTNTTKGFTGTCN
jgi:hypothetical protein